MYNGRMAPASMDRLQELLEGEYTWPAPYLFKFIVPQEHVPVVEALLGAGEVLRRESRGGRYVSLTARRSMESAEQVLAVYRRASQVKGLIAL